MFKYTAVFTVLLFLGIAAIIGHFNQLGCDELDVLDFVAYMPLFNEMHDAVTDQPLCVDTAPLLCNGEDIDFAVRRSGTAMPGTCIGGDTSSQSQGSCRAIVFIL